MTLAVTHAKPDSQRKFSISEGQESSKPSSPALGPTTNGEEVIGDMMELTTCASSRLRGWSAVDDVSKFPVLPVTPGTKSPSIDEEKRATPPTTSVDSVASVKPVFAEAPPPPPASKIKISKRMSSGKLFKKVPFQLFICTDEDCEFIQPTHNEVSTKHQNTNMVRLLWEGKPKSILIVKKPGDEATFEKALEIAKWCHETEHMLIYMEKPAAVEMNLPFIKLWSEEEGEDLASIIDSIISIGGDGTCIWAQGLFKRSVPPIISLAMGSLGFLTLFEPERCIDHLKMVNSGDFYLR
jgi:hypothetical protein